MEIGTIRKLSKLQKFILTEALQSYHWEQKRAPAVAIFSISGNGLESLKTGS